jgi:hypothetical protein
VTEDRQDLQDPLHQALRALPAPRAPRTLLPRVMTAVEARAAADAARTVRRPATTARPWLAWPIEWQVASVAAVVLFSAAAAWIWPGVEAAAGALLSQGRDIVETRVAAVAPGATALAHLGAVVWETFLQPLACFAVVWIVVMSAACAAFAAALERVAFGEAS